MERKIKTYTQTDFANFLNINYNARNDCASFIEHYTKLFNDVDGTPQKYYNKQIEFMNCLSPKDKIIAVLKSRQCLTGDTVIKIINRITNKVEVITIKQLYEKMQMFGNKFCIQTLNDKKELVFDGIDDIWISDKKDIYKISTDEAILKCTREHNIKTLDGWKKVDELTTDDYVQFVDESLCNCCTDIEYIRIKDIERINEEVTYDLTTQYYNSYLANGILVHNCGISTSIVARAVFDCYFGKYLDIVIISSTSAQSKKIMRRIRDCYREMPEIMQPNFVVDNAQEIRLQNKCGIIAVTSTPRNARGYSGKIFWDEVASFTVNEQEGVFKAIYPSITKGGIINMVSTPDGKEGKFYDFCTKPLNEITGKKTSYEIKKFFIHWKDVPHTTYAVKNEGLFDFLTPDEIRQEYELNFLDSNTTEQFFSKDFILMNIREQWEDIPLYKSYTDLNIPLSYLDDMKKPLSKELHLKEIKEKYEMITAGWDIASKDNDSVLIVLGKLRNEIKYHIIGEFILNRGMGKQFEDIILQSQYLVRIIECMQVDKLNVDSTGMGEGVYQYLKNETSISEICYGYNYSVHRNDKLTNFIKLKQLIGEGKIKRNWLENKETREFVQQFTNLQYNSLNHSLKALNRKKDDIPNALMLAMEFFGNIAPNLYLI